ncbi:uncharacterized protein Dana_GF10116 [Drosophila ananassae]|uniref:Cuticle protein 6 n=1 Tax=Drosophila ananassae TaxID=7217 RepID=B3M5S4_DROAN|nr:cuticle protein 16.8 [Drosophila ananassae]EDV39614.1 uncharacterized protein Dana_GF10116 [Drosophila ananassae]
MKYPLLLLGSLSLAHGLALYATTYPLVYTAQGSAVFTPTQRQYFAQDQAGQYAYGYSEPLSSKQETRTLDGTTIGSYRYRDALGKLQTVQYVADGNGFHVAATNLPKAVVPQEQADISPRSSSTPVEHHSDVSSGRSVSHTVVHPVEHPVVVSHPVVAHPVVQHPVDVSHHSTVVKGGRSAQPEQPYLAENHKNSVEEALIHKTENAERRRQDEVDTKTVARSHHVVVPAHVYGYPVPRYYAPGVYF